MPTKRVRRKLWACRSQTVAIAIFRSQRSSSKAPTGYAARSSQPSTSTSFSAFARGGSFREGVLLAANLGDDAETTAAVYGQLAGAHYGEEGIPAEWRSKLALRGTIEDLADRLHAAAGPSTGLRRRPARASPTACARG